MRIHFYRTVDGEIALKVNKESRQLITGANDILDVGLYDEWPFIKEMVLVRGYSLTLRRPDL